MKVVVLIILAMFLTAASSGAEGDCPNLTDQIEINNCYDQLFSDSENQIYTSDDYTVLMAYEMFFIKKSGHDPIIIFGKMSTLNEIVSVSISKRRQEIAVLNINAQGVKEILFFPIVLSGMIKPFRVIKAEEIKECNRLLFNNDGSDIIALDDEGGYAFSFSSSANSLSVEEGLHPSVVERNYNDF